VREGSKWIYRDPGGSFVATLQPDGGVEFRNDLVDVSVVASPGLGGTGEHFVNVKVEYDPVGVARLSRGRDPSPRTKAKLLAATFEMRMEIATKYHKQRLLDQLNGIADELDESRRDYANAARQKIIRFIRSTVPANGPDAYTEAELAALNQRRVSEQRFTPYES
jgi:hypothetical protein